MKIGILKNIREKLTKKEELESLHSERMEEIEIYKQKREEVKVKLKEQL